MKHLKYFEDINNFGHNIDVIRENYFEAALWTDDYYEELEDKTIFDFSHKAKEQTNTEIMWFINTAGDILDDISDADIGHDLWLTRNGHGSGFSDRGYDDDIDDALSELSKQLGPVHLEVNDEKIDVINDSNEFLNFDIEKYKEELKFNRTVKKYNL